MHRNYKKFFLWIFLYLAFISHTPIFALVQNNENNISTPVTLREWKQYSQEAKRRTCASIFYGIVLENQLDFHIDNRLQLEEYADKIVAAINLWYSDNSNDNLPIEDVILDSIFQLGLTDKNYSKFSSKTTRNNSYNPNKKVFSVPDSINKENRTKTSNKSTNTKIQPKIKFMSKKEGRAWVKKNLHLRADFPLDDLVQRFGQYEKKTTGNAELYYFKRIDMTFFLMKIHSSMEFVGLSEGKPKH